MTAPIVLASSVLAVVLVVALVREVRLRRALQKLLSRLLSHWRNRDVENHTLPPSDGDDSAAAGRDRV